MGCLCILSEPPWSLSSVWYHRLLYQTLLHPTVLTPKSIVPIIGSISLVHGQSCCGHSLISLPQCAQHGLALEDHPNISTGPEYSGMHNFRKSMICPCYSTAMGDALGSSFFPCPIQGVITFKALNGIGPRCLRHCLSLRVSACFTNRMGIQIPSLRCCHLTRPRKCFLVAVPDLWHNIPPLPIFLVY